MRIEPGSNKPLYVQIAEGIEADIMEGILQEEGRAYSQYQVADDISINPATAGKGIKLLEQDGILFKKRGLGMFVAKGAKDKIRNKRAKLFKTEMLHDLFEEARKLGFTKEDLKQMIDELEV